MKKTKKMLLFVLTIILISAISFTAFPAIATSRIELNNEVEYTYEGISAEKAKQIVSAMSGLQDNTIVQPDSIFCLFGHSISTGVIITTEHRVYSDNPRCYRTTDSIEYCTRNSCSYFAVTGTRGSRIGCC